ncbi:MAG: PIN domain-containing protein [Rhizobiaceae bacterium]
MIAFDTNLLLRVTLFDDAKQAKAAEAIVTSTLAARDEIYVNPIALSEFTWTLDRTYKANRAEIAGAVRQFLDCPPYRLFDSEIVEAALDYFESSKADFSDCLIGAMNNAMAIQTTYTFDKAAASLDVFTMPPKV